VSDDVDYIVVGAGTAGSVVAGTLAARSTRRVMVVEAGGRPARLFTRVPAASVSLLGRPSSDWRYQSEPDPSRDGARETWSAGKLVGGTSAINGMLYIRGAPADYDAWAALGNAGWASQDVLPAFRAIESAEAWPVALTRTTHDLCAPFIEAMVSLGFPRTPDYNGTSFEGVGLARVTQANGLRVTTARAFLDAHVAAGRVALMQNAHCTKLLFEGSRCSGVEVLRGGRVEVMRARRGVVVSAGAIGSPALLLRSGIGPAGELHDVGIATRVDAPGVGRSLMDHPVALITIGVNVPTYNADIRGIGGLRHLIHFLLHRRGMMTSPHAQVLAHVRSHPNATAPDVQIALYPMSFERTDDGARTRAGNSVLMTVTACRSESRGRVTLRAADPLTAPRIEHELLGSPAELRTLINGCRLVERIAASQPFSTFVTGFIDPKGDQRSDEDWEQYLRSGGAALALHAAGTCRMGSDTDPSAVVDPQLRVRGVEGLSVADTSIMPSLVSGNTQAAAAMIGLRAAGFLLA
jgi:choline dehydrogenase